MWQLFKDSFKDSSNVCIISNACTFLVQRKVIAILTRITLSCRLHSGGRVDSVAEQTVPGHGQANHASDTRSCSKSSDFPQAFIPILYKV